MFPAANDGPKASDLVGSLGGLAALAGINVESGGHKEEAIAILESRAFSAAFIRDLNLLPVLFPKRWDVAAKDWINPDKAPSIEDGVTFLDRRIKKITTAAGSQSVTLSVEWTDPQIAADWANQLASRLNETMRQRDIARAESSIAYLQQQLEKTQVVEIRASLFRLLETQIKNIMLAQVNVEYAMKIIDPAAVSPLDDFVRPKRALIIAIGFFVGLIVAAVIVVWRESVRSALREVPQ